MIDHGGRRLRRGLDGRPVQPGEFFQHGGRAQLLFLAGLRQWNLAATAEIELQAAEDGGGAGQLDGDLANGLLSAFGDVGKDLGSSVVHGGPLKIHFECMY